MLSRFSLLPYGIRSFYSHIMSCKGFSLPSISVNKGGEILIQVHAKPGAKSNKITG